MDNRNITPRSSADRRSGFDRRKLSPDEARMLSVCKTGGAVFIGIQSGFGCTPDLCLFSAPGGNPVCAEPVSTLTPLRIVSRLATAMELHKEIAAQADFLANNINEVSARAAHS